MERDGSGAYNARKSVQAATDKTKCKRREALEARCDGTRQNRFIVIGLSPLPASLALSFSPFLKALCAFRHFWGSQCFVCSNQRFLEDTHLFHGGASQRKCHREREMKKVTVLTTSLFQTPLVTGWQSLRQLVLACRAMDTHTHTHSDSLAG